ncbi:MAG: outer membrane beta-barrel protein [Bacteroidia bacterium]
MKKTSSLFIGVAIACFSLFGSQKANAQKEAGQSVVTVGAGQSLVGSLFTIASSNGNSNLSSTPAILAMYDYGISDKFSLGGAFSYQSFSSSYTNSSYTYTNSNGQTVYESSWSDKITRMNYAVRALFHFGENKDFDPYFGVRLGFTNWSASTTNTDPNYNNYGVGIKTLFAPQVLFGVRYFFTPLIGVNAEAAIGSPYFIAGGVNFRFGGK